VSNDNPFIERPEEHELLGDELFCWMPGDDQRMCGPSCVAFESRSLDPNSGLSTCTLLNSFRSMSASIHSMVRRDDVKRRQEVIKEQPSPPAVR
jgi:hypothetical protein